ncbi:hypothetical protein Q3C01_11475 [Bradyrhizobium sp. UFLA05-109]
MACRPGGGCDGRDGEARYRWRRPHMSIAYIYRNGMDEWRRCRVDFSTKDRMVLENCNLPSDPWVRER